MLVPTKVIWTNCIATRTRICWLTRRPILPNSKTHRPSSSLTPLSKILPSTKTSSSPSPITWASAWQKRSSAVNKAGAIPFAVKGDAKGFQGYNLITIVKASSPYKTVADLKGKKVAHTAPSSNSGHLAPVALLPAQGLTPGKDYEIKFSGKHDQSVMGVNTGDYDAAHVASDVFDRMGDRGQIKEADFRVIYRSQRFPTSSFAHAHDLKPELAAKLVKCFADFRYPAEMQKNFDGADRFVSINYAKDWDVVRTVDKAAESAAKK